MALYPQDIKGFYRRLKDVTNYLLLLFYLGMSWLRWDRGPGAPNQAIMIDLSNRRVYLFGIDIWPDEIYYLMGILIIAAIFLFLITSLFGRVWCGFTCPHTVFVDLFRKVEKFFQGDRNKILRLNSLPNNLNKIMKKCMTHICWIILSFMFAFGWECYFYDSFALTNDVIHLQVSFNATLWLVGITGLTYLFAGFIRERMCIYLCPYGRFQSGMLDNYSHIVTYHDWRGEPAGYSKDNNQQFGDCIDCGKCVIVCPMGVDIRNGLQIGCIGCGLCIDACDSVMAKLSRPLGLIHYDSAISTEIKKLDRNYQNNYFATIFRVKTLLFLSVIVVSAYLMLYMLLHKKQYKIYFERDRSALYTVLADGSIRNTYIIKIHNRSRQSQLYKIRLEYGQFMIQDLSDYSDRFNITLEPNTEIKEKVFVKVEEGKTLKQIKWFIKIENEDEQEIIEPFFFKF